MENERIKHFRTHEQVMADMLKDPEVKAEYDALEEEFRQIQKQIEARRSRKIKKAQHTKPTDNKS